MGKYILSVVGANGQNNAGSKAGNDVLRVSQECGYKLIPLYESNQVRTRVQDIISGAFDEKHIPHSEAVQIKD